MSLRHALLGLLVDKPASGYDLLKDFAGSLANVWPATQSQIYTELTKMAAAELITVTDAGPRGRKEYALTDAGLAELRHWLTEIPPNRPQRSDVLLRVFFLGVVDREQAREYLRGLAEKARQEHEELVGILERTDWEGGDLATYGRLALEYGLRFTDTRREWAEWAVDRIRT
ncbi:PadR family transcriptional regulator [Actinocatenispora rupis]|uniref:PadR family transcriptional regulator n=1 Tax=Actinocatenispora rupis TaxID=519421 RepID=A0A8J3JBU4_9ACTN|nr:PadR family transcriptional regulator [Actinocatenispora rupis]GID13662.1 PadR family transcriptional regulator [Actinocatenispora rupis]